MYHSIWDIERLYNIPPKVTLAAIAARQLRARRGEYGWIIRREVAEEWARQFSAPRVLTG